MLQDELHAVFGAHGDHGFGGVPVVGGQAKAEALEDDNHEGFRFEQSEVLADTDARTNTEGQESGGMLASFGDTILESLGTEVIGIIPPQCCVAVYIKSRDCETHALWKIKLAHFVHRITPPSC